MIIKTVTVYWGLFSLCFRGGDDFLSLILIFCDVLVLVSQYQ